MSKDKITKKNYKQKINRYFKDKKSLLVKGDYIHLVI